MTREGVLSCVILRHNDDSKLGATTYMTLLSQLLFVWSHSLTQWLSYWYSPLELLQNLNQCCSNMSLPLQQQFVITLA